MQKKFPATGFSGLLGQRGLVPLGEGRRLYRDTLGTVSWFTYHGTSAFKERSEANDAPWMLCTVSYILSTLGS